MPNAPKTYYLQPTKYVPNSDLPVLHYEDVLPRPYEEASTTAFLERNGWEKRGTWGAIANRHFHPNTHECYGIFHGSSTLLLGLGAADGDLDVPLAKSEHKSSPEVETQKRNPTTGLRLRVKVGDVVVLPAGTAHCSVTSEGDYRYIGVYPVGCPKWRSEYGKHDSQLEASKEECRAVQVPSQDPVYGLNGYLTEFWKIN